MAGFDRCVRWRPRRQDKTCVVIGGAGFLGGHLVQALEAAGARVVIFDIRAVKCANPRTTSVAGDLCNFQVWARGLRCPRPVCVSHVCTERCTVQEMVKVLTGADTVFLVASPPPELDDEYAVPTAFQIRIHGANNTPRVCHACRPLFMRVNVRGAENILQACAATGVKVRLLAPPRGPAPSADRGSLVSAVVAALGAHELCERVLRRQGPPRRHRGLAVRRQARRPVHQDQDLAGAGSFQRPQPCPAQPCPARPSPPHPPPAPPCPALPRPTSPRPAPPRAALPCHPPSSPGPREWCWAPGSWCSRPTPRRCRPSRCGPT